MGPRAGLVGCEKFRPPPTGIRSPDRPARRETLYRLRTPIPTPTVILIIIIIIIINILLYFTFVMSVLITSRFCTGRYIC